VTIDDEPIRAATLSATVEWRTVHPGADVVWDDSKDEELGLGLVDFDPSAYVCRWFQVADAWTAVADGYRRRMAGFGWSEQEPILARWWRWSHADRPGEVFDLILRTRGPGMFWPAAIREGMTVFEFRYVRSAGRYDAAFRPHA
jgi:hypothetical protein